MTREDVATFLKNHSGKTKEEVLMDFTSYALANGVLVDKIGKLIMDLRSYKEWTWGE
jgi:hypothetical protein